MSSEDNKTRKKIATMGGDSLDENFLIGSDSETASSSSRASNPTRQSKRCVITDYDPEISSSDEDEDIKRGEPTSPLSKKAKLNWRESATINDGSPKAQKHILENLLVAAAKYFPSHDTNLRISDLDRLTFLDCEEFFQRPNKSVLDMLEFLKTETNLLRGHSGGDLNTILVSGSASRAMYMVKELRSLDSGHVPLTLFFHGGGRKKEQSKTHESVLKGRKTSTLVALPSRLKAVAEQGLISFGNIELLVFDLKPNEKKLNVLSQKETLLDVLEILERFIIPNSSSALKLALI